MDRSDIKILSEEHRLPQDIAEPESIDQSRRRFTKSGLIVSGVLLTLASRPSFGGGNTGGNTGLGGTNIGRSPSGFCSGNLSHRHTHQGGAGKSCSYWSSMCKSWPSTPCNSYFSNNFDCTHASNCNYDSKGNKYALLDILCRQHVCYAQSYSYNSKTKTYQYNDGGTTRNCDSKGYDSNAYNYIVCPTDFTAYKSVDSSCDTDSLGQYCVAALLNCRGGYTPYLTESTVKEMFSSCKANGYFEPTAGVHWTSSQCVAYLQATQNCTSYIL